MKKIEELERRKKENQKLHAFDRNGYIVEVNNVNGFPERMIFSRCVGCNKITYHTQSMEAYCWDCWMDMERYPLMGGSEA